MASIVGRDDALDRAWRELSATGAVVVEGPAGVGKSAVLGALVSRATASGMRVLSCSPSEVESELPLAALFDLLDPWASGVGGLPSAQRRAVDVVLLRNQADAALDERALGAATRTLLDLAADGPGGLLLVIDDVPWLDPPSERALRFALRRTGRPVAVLVGCRTPRRGPLLPLGLDTRPCATVTLGPLDDGSLREILVGRFGIALSRTTLARVAAESGGNPLMAIELTRALLRRPDPLRPGEDLPTVASIQGLVDDTLATLPKTAVDAIRLTALLCTPTLAVLATAGVASATLDAAEDAGLIRVHDEGAVEFVHPTFATAVRAGLAPGRRRQLHRRLAEVCADPDERARQLAYGVLDPDAEVADELANAAVRAQGRGAPELAAHLYRRSAELTPGDDLALSRRLASAQSLFDGGDLAAAGAVAGEVAARAQGEDRANAHLLEAAVAWVLDDLDGAVAAGLRALEAVEPGSALTGRIHTHLAMFTENPAAARAHAATALQLLPPEPDWGPASGPFRQDDRAMVAAALMMKFENDVRAGDPPPLDLMDRALALESGEPLWVSGTVPAIYWKYTDDHDRARERLEWMYERAFAAGDEPFQHEIASHLGEVELLAGRYPAAARWIRLARDLGRQLNTGSAGETWLQGMLDARRGDLEAAARAAREGLAEAEQRDDPWRRRLNLHLAGVTALTSGRAAEAAASFVQLADTVDDLGLVEPLGSRFEDEWIEACVALGELDAAARVLDRLAARHERIPRPWSTLGLARGRLLVAAAARESVDVAIADAAAALESVAPDVLPLERARCLHAIGMAHRRARRKQAARDAFEKALAAFTTLGAEAHAARVREELDRTGTPRASDTGLTVTEERVARLAADGKTNRVIADELFISPKTVESNLVRAYRKLGISRRAELGVALARLRPPDR